MNKRIMESCLLVSGLALVIFLFARCGQTATLDYPTRPVEVVVSTSPGGIADIAVRLLSTKLSEIFGVPLVISNKPAGSGAAGIESVVKAKPDGYTVWGGADSPVVLLPLVNPEVSFTFRNLLPIAQFALAPNAILVRNDSSFKTLRELLDFAKKNPRKLIFGSTGAAHMSRISIELIKKAAGVEIVHVPYQGGGPLKSAILGGHVDLACDSIAAVFPLVKAGNLRVLAICSEKRYEDLPQVPSVFELGYPNASLPLRVGYMVPLGTPKPIIDKWNQAIQKALADPSMERQLRDASLSLDYKPPEAMAKNLESNDQILSGWIKEGGLTKK